jgi:hypothetical protein
MPSHVLLTDPVKLLAYRVLDATKAPPALQSKIQPRSDTKAAPVLPKPESKADAKAAPQPDPVSKVPAKAEPQPEAKIEPPSEAKPAPEPEAKAKPRPVAGPTSDVDTTVTTLMNTTLGELLVAGALKHPEDAGQILADGVVQTKAHIEAAKAPPTQSRSKP